MTDVAYAAPAAAQPAQDYYAPGDAEYYGPEYAPPAQAFEEAVAPVTPAVHHMATPGDPGLGALFDPALTAEAAPSVEGDLSTGDVTETRFDGNIPDWLEPGGYFLAATTNLGVGPETPNKNFPTSIPFLGAVTIGSEHINDALGKAIMEQDAVGAFEELSEIGFKDLGAYASFTDPTKMDKIGPVTQSRHFAFSTTQDQEGLGLKTGSGGPGMAWSMDIPGGQKLTLWGNARVELDSADPGFGVEGGNARAQGGLMISVPGSNKASKAVGNAILASAIANDATIPATATAGATAGAIGGGAATAPAGGVGAVPGALGGGAAGALLPLADDIPALVAKNMFDNARLHLGLTGAFTKAGMNAEGELYVQGQSERLTIPKGEEMAFIEALMNPSAAGDPAEAPFASPPPTDAPPSPTLAVRSAPPELMGGAESWEDYLAQSTSDVPTRPGDVNTEVYMTQGLTRAEAVSANEAYLAAREDGYDPDDAWTIGWNTTQ